MNADVHEKKHIRIEEESLCVKLFICCSNLSNCIITIGDLCRCVCFSVILFIFIIAIYLAVTCHNIGILNCTRGILHGFGNITR